LWHWLFGYRREITDPELGILTFKNRSWRVRTAGGLPMLLVAGRRGPDEALCQIGRETLAQLAALEAGARRYLAGTGRSQAWPALTLSAVEIGRPAAEWVRNEIAQGNPRAAEMMLQGVPVVSLQFEIVGDRNVADVTFLYGVPVAWDYH
jgi:hypothetical protein